MSSYNTTLKKQATNKYDNRKRLQNEKKTSRISLRTDKETKSKFDEMAKRSNITKTQAFEMLIKTGAVLEMPSDPTAISTKINNLNERLNTIESLLKKEGTGQTQLLFDHIKEEFKTTKSDYYYAITER